MRRGFFWVLLSALGIALAFFMTRQVARPPLPRLSHDANLPLLFNEALETAHRRVRENRSDPEPLRHLAHLYQANRLFAEAHQCYAAIKASPGGLTARDHYDLAVLAQNEGDLPAAQEELRQVIVSDSHYLPARLALAETLFKSGQEEEAAQQYSAILKSVPNDPYASVGLARIALQNGKDAEAVTRLEKVLAEHPEFTSAAALLSQILNRRGETERAAALTQWSERKHEPAPPDPWMNELLADCYDPQLLTLKFEEYLSAGQEEQALPFLERVEMLDPQNWIPQLLRGWIHARSLRYDEAVQQYRQALAKGGDPEIICPRVVAALLATGKLADAETFIAEYHQKLPDSPAVLLAYTEVAQRKEDQPKARTLLAKLLSKQPYLYSPNIELAKILWTTNEREEAVQCIKRVAKAYPADVASRGLLAQYYLEKADWFSALAPLEEAMAQTSTESSAKKQLTLMLETASVRAAKSEMEQGKFAEAAEHFDRATQIAPNDLEAYVGKANCCVELKQFTRAAEALQKIASLQPDNPTIELSLGDVLHQQGELTRAREHWQKALKLTPETDTDLRQALRQRLSGELSTETLP